MVEQNENHGVGGDGAMVDDGWGAVAGHDELEDDGEEV